MIFCGCPLCKSVLLVSLQATQHISYYWTSYLSGTDVVQHSLSRIPGDGKIIFNIQLSRGLKLAWSYPCALARPVHTCRLFCQIRKWMPACCTAHDFTFSISWRISSELTCTSLLLAAESAKYALIWCSSCTRSFVACSERFRLFYFQFCLVYDL